MKVGIVAEGPADIAVLRNILKSGEKKPRDDEGRRERKSEYDIYDDLSLGFRDRSRLEACAQRNRSLRLFVDSL